MEQIPLSGSAFIIDDDAAMRDALTWLLHSRSIRVQSWPSAEAFLVDCHPGLQGCIILDVRMPAMGGLALFDHLKLLNCHLPVIFLTGHGKVEHAVSALKKGAFDFIEKPFDDNALADRVLEAIAWNQQRLAQGQRASAVHEHLRSLTSREHEVMICILKGCMNKVIADQLGIAMRTVEVHRAHIFEKMRVKSAVELATLLADHDITPTPHTPGASS
jgi:two-component system, LuxR family, response regulator DctR